MTPERFRKIDELVSQALDRPAQERAEFIRFACAGEDELLAEVESLLASHEKRDGFLGEAPGRLAAQWVAESMGQALGASGTPPTSPPAPGRYRILQQLGTGGMGVVYLAEDPELGRRVAIKLMRPEASRNISASEGRARLMREAHAMAQLSHPNVIAVYDVGTFGDQVFIAMEYVEGSTLTKWLAEHQRTWREIVNMFVQTGRGLAAAHAASILHRDFKPDNVLVGKDGRPRVLDFGLARALFGEPEKRAHSDENDERAKLDASSPSILALLGLALTQTGRLMGTPAYMAPEQLMGQPADHRTDQYSFCVALYQALYGELPFKAQNVEALVREITQGKPPEAVSSQVPSRLRRVVLRGLRPKPADRYPSMGALLDELVFQATRTRRRFVSVAVFAIVVVMAAVAGIVWKKRTPAQPNVQSIAILPLKNLGDASDEATVEGLTDGLTTTVAQLTSATVISQNSSARYKTSPKSLQEIGRELAVDAVVSGSAKRSGSRLQVGTRLISVATGGQLWTRTFESESGQLPMLQADIAAGLLVEVDSRRITSEQEAQLARLRSVKPEVQEACLKGWLLEKRGDATSVQKSIAYFQEAIREDPSYAPAYVGLARHLGSRKLATEALMKALSLDPNLGEAHAALSSVKMATSEWRAGGEEAKRAIELSPNDALAHRQLTHYLLHMQRLDEALVEAKRAQRLDPLSVYGQIAIARVFQETKQYDRAIEEWRKAIELEPNRPGLYWYLSLTYDEGGRYAEALAPAQKAYALSGAQSHRAQVALVLVHLGKTDEAERIIEEIKSNVNYRDAAFPIAVTYGALKRKEETFKWLELAYEAGKTGLAMMSRVPDLYWLRSDPRFQDLVKRVGLEQLWDPSARERVYQRH